MLSAQTLGFVFLSSEIKIKIENKEMGVSENHCELLWAAQTYLTLRSYFAPFPGLRSNNKYLTVCLGVCLFFHFCFTDVGEDLLQMCKRNIVLNKHMLKSAGEKTVKSATYGFPQCTDHTHKHRHTAGDYAASLGSVSAPRTLCCSS